MDSDGVNPPPPPSGSSSVAVSPRATMRMLGRLPPPSSVPADDSLDNDTCGGVDDGVAAAAVPGLLLMVVVVEAVEGGAFEVEGAPAPRWLDAPPLSFDDALTADGDAAAPALTAPDFPVDSPFVGANETLPFLVAAVTAAP